MQIAQIKIHTANASPVARPITTTAKSTGATISTAAIWNCICAAHRIETMFSCITGLESVSVAIPEHGGAGWSSGISVSFELYDYESIGFSRGTRAEQPSEPFMNFSILILNEFSSFFCGRSLFLQ